MNSTMKFSAAIAAALMALVRPAYAHVDYFDLSANLFVNGAGQSYDEEFFSDFGWYNGTQPTLGDTHELAGGVFFKFHLDHASRVDIGFGQSDTTGTLNPAFSLYAGLLPDEGHDDTLTDPLNPAHVVATPFPHAVKDPSPVDDGVTTDAHGNVSPFRDTANVTYIGQFNALGDWSLANDLGEFGAIKYLTHVEPQGTGVASLNAYLLAAGDYTVAAAGGTPGGTVSNILGTVTFKASAVPVPTAVWMFVPALFSVGANIVRRRESV